MAMARTDVPLSSLKLRLKVTPMSNVPVMSWWGRVYSNHDDSEEVTCGHSGFPSDEWEWVEADADDNDPNPPETEAGFHMTQQSLQSTCFCVPVCPSFFV